jgi:hypothetical protein
VLESGSTSTGSDAPLAAESLAVARPVPQPPSFGVSLDGGFPDFAGISAVWRPWRMLRLHGGVLYNGAAPGLRAGVSFVPFDFFITPALTAEYGHFFGGDGNFLAEGLSLDTGGALGDVLDNLQYTFVNVHLGLEMGLPNRFVLYLRAGLTRLETTLHGSGAAVEEYVNDPTLEVSDFQLRGNVPSLKLGLLFYFG